MLSFLHSGFFLHFLLNFGYKFAFLQVLDLVVRMDHTRPMSIAAASKVPLGARKV